MLPWRAQEVKVSRRSRTAASELRCTVDRAPLAQQKARHS
jgi:hypothetical protein